MERKRDIQTLRRYMLLLQIVLIGMILFGGIAIRLFLDPTFLGGKAKATEPIWLWVGIGFIAFAILCITLSIRHTRRLLWTLNNVTPQTMQLSIRLERDSDKTNYWAVLDQMWQVSVYSPSWKVHHLQEVSIQAQVYFDPKNQRPVVIETKQGILWGMVGRAAYRF